MVMSFVYFVRLQSGICPGHHGPTGAEIKSWQLVLRTSGSQDCCSTRPQMPVKPPRDAQLMRRLHFPYITEGACLCLCSSPHHISACLYVLRQSRRSFVAPVHPSSWGKNKMSWWISQMSTLDPVFSCHAPIPLFPPMLFLSFISRYHA